MFVICINSLIKASFEELQRFEHPPKDDGSLSLLVIGDWGRNGHFNQSKVDLQVLNLFLSWSLENIGWEELERN